MNFKTLFSIALTLGILEFPYVYADEESDKAEFKKLYAEFNELYANSTEIDPIIEVAEKLYKIAPELYGENSQNTAVVTYNLASLYDEKGQNYPNQAEQKAVELYKLYFKIQDVLEVVKDEAYLEQYTSFIIAEFNLNRSKSEKKYSQIALELAKHLNSPNLIIADIEYLVAYQHYLSGEGIKSIPYFEIAKKHYIDEFGNLHVKVGRSIEWIAKIHQAEGANETSKEADEFYKKAEKYYLETINIYENIKPLDKKLIAGAYQSLSHLYLLMERLDDCAKYAELATKMTDEPYDASLPIIRVAPQYPLRAAENGISGWVLVEFEVDIDGRTNNVKVLDSSHKMFEKNAIWAAKKFRFAPSLKDGKRVIATGVQNRIEFQLVN